MGKYGEVAIKATKLSKSNNPKSAWEEAFCQKFGKETSSQCKGCPRCTFLGLCEEGKIKGVCRGNYTKSKKNKEYALQAVQILQKHPGFCSNKTELWRKVTGEIRKAHNGQMDVVVSLWNNKLII